LQVQQVHADWTRALAVDPVTNSLFTGGDHADSSIAISILDQEAAVKHAASSSGKSKDEQRVPSRAGADRGAGAGDDDDEDSKSSQPQLQPQSESSSESRSASNQDVLSPEEAVAQGAGKPRVNRTAEANVNAEKARQTKQAMRKSAVPVVTVKWRSILRYDGGADGMKTDGVSNYLITGGAPAQQNWNDKSIDKIHCFSIMQLPSSDGSAAGSAAGAAAGAPPAVARAVSASSSSARAAAASEGVRVLIAGCFTGDVNIWRLVSEGPKSGTSDRSNDAVSECTSVWHVLLNHTHRMYD